MILVSPDTKLPSPTRTPEYYEQRLNPDKKLPPVVIEKVKTFRNDPQEHREFSTTTKFLIKNVDNQTVGNFSLDVDTLVTKEPTASFSSFWLETDPDFRRQGYGRATYLEILKYLGEVKLKSGVLDNYSQATKIWNWLVEKGVARKREPLIVEGGARYAYEII